MKAYVATGLGVVSVLLFILLYNSWFYTLIESIISPLFLVCFTLFLSNLYLLLFNKSIQQSWWRWARFAVVVPFVIILIMLPTYQKGGGFISFGGTTDLVILWGVVFGLATFIYTLYQRFYRRTGVAK